MRVEVKDVMTRECRECALDDTLATAALRMWEADCGVLPVVANGLVVAMVTDRDICMGLAFRGCRPQDCAVAEVASREVVFCAPGDEIVHALSMMGHRRLRRLPVLESGRLVGMLSLNDIVTCEGENAEIRQPILAALEAISSHRALPAAA